MDRFDRLFIATAFSLQIALLLYFIWRKYDYSAALGWGWIVYALGVPAVLVSLWLLSAGRAWYFWLGGFLFGLWAGYGYIVDIRQAIPWRSPIFPPVFFPYVTLYLAAQMFYWWPLGAIQRPLWYIYAALFTFASYFNLTSHGG
jgi:hypothetical protein